jgi:hypothetical protein
MFVKIIKLTFIIHHKARVLCNPDEKQVKAFLDSKFEFFAVVSALWKEKKEVQLLKDEIFL